MQLATQHFGFNGLPVCTWQWQHVKLARRLPVHKNDTVQDLEAAQRSQELKRFRASRVEQESALEAAKEHLKRLEKMSTSDVKAEYKMTKGCAIKDTKRNIEAKQVSRTLMFSGCVQSVLAAVMSSCQ